MPAELGHEAGGNWRALELNGKSRGAANFFESGTIVFHRRIVRQPGPHLPKDVGRVRVWRLNQAIVNPLAVAPRGNHARTAQISKMPGNLRLINLQNFDEEAHANFVVSNEIYQPQTSVIRECLEQEFETIFLVAHAVLIYRFGGLVITIVSASEFLFHRLIYV